MIRGTTTACCPLSPHVSTHCCLCSVFDSFPHSITGSSRALLCCQSHGTEPSGAITALCHLSAATGDRMGSLPSVLATGSVRCNPQAQLKELIDSPLTALKHCLRSRLMTSFLVFNLGVTFETSREDRLLIV